MTKRTALISVSALVIAVAGAAQFNLLTVPGGGRLPRRAYRRFVEQCDGIGIRPTSVVFLSESKPSLTPRKRPLALPLFRSRRLAAAS